MKFFLELAAFLPLLIDSAVAQKVSCRTTMGTKSIKKVPTSTITTTSKKQPTQTLIVQRTVTSFVGLVSTSTGTTISTSTVTEDVKTDTFSTTTTIFDVTSFTETVTQTTTTTDTATVQSVSTTIVPTNDGFLNIADTINHDSMAKRALAMRNPHTPNKRALQKGPIGLLAMSFPSKVVCTLTQPNTLTVTSYTTLTPITRSKVSYTKTITQISTITSTSTVIPAEVSTTLTFSATSSVSTTTTLISTSTTNTVTTTTEVLSGPTVFNACNSQNIFGANFNNNGSPYYAVNVANNGPNVGTDFQAVADGASTAMDCCAACQRLGNCENFIFRAKFRNCFLLSHDGATCAAQSDHPNFILSKQGNDPGSGYQVGNGNCGFAWSGNSDGSLFPADGYN